MTTARTIDPALLQTASRLLDQEWQNFLTPPEILTTPTPEKPRPETSGGAHCPLNWVLENLVDLLAELHDRPAADLVPAIRQIIAEMAFIDDWGGVLPAQDRKTALDRQVDLAVHVLEKVRKHALDAGQWSETPTTPMMCG